MAAQVRTGFSMHDGQRDISRDVLQRVAEAIRSAAASRSVDLVLDYGIPATTLPDAIGRLDALQRLVLINTGLESLPDSLGQLHQLRHLQVAYAGLKKLPPSLTRLPRLNTLVLTGMPLEELPADLGRMQRLRRLILNYGHYERLPASVTQLGQLTKLSISSSSHLRELPENIGIMQGLRALEVSSNSKLEQLPGSITQLGRLEELDLSSNSRLVQLPEDISQMRGLTKLSLKHCAALRQLPDSVGDLAQLQLLDLRYTGLQTLPQCLARLPATCEIKVADRLSNQLIQIRDPERAQREAQQLAERRRRAAASAAEQAGPSLNRVPEFTRVLRDVDAELGELFDKWTQGLAQNAMMFRAPITSADMVLLDQIVAEAIRSPEFRRSFCQFLSDHTLKRLNMDGMTQVGGRGPAVRGDVKTAFAEMLKHKLMHTQNHETALGLLQEALRNRGLGLSRQTLLRSRNELTGRTEMWPPLKAYISMHDVEGKAAQDAATTWAMAQLDEAYEGVIGEAEAKQESEKAQADANRFIEGRARALLREWNIR
ncbi:HpaF protein [Xanthomonas citri pv. fuscans CFBP 6996]|uniref:type III secretion system effector XopAE n=1 Tax=Xanthomonas citri TaxID=346 RepID=UPI000C1949F7|nr:type III secretion system effector XopAE [Xanthomonas citri]ATS50174.1 leucine-rich repeat domain-containing protein [Xanthomonas citri pv. phaseoli var. fuscans]ATS55909.1 leucine-rich repeat domain-containing protein [Xanthomonas citri pv. phaseoli var. fuscans]ATS60076.1 leucine-rich repeat domain-containing protein [Xanthomonas citri pv. phaseoli var. fuscans]PTY30852.1 HpaF protein [Xanthomonas citri pv. fuscans CFBP 6996]QWN14789.1 HpaF protein [Xanthomonas citri]